MVFTVHLHPGAKKTAVEWLDGDTLKAWVRAVAEKGKANEALLELLSDELDVPKNRISIIRGHTTRLKQIEVKNSA